MAHANQRPIEVHLASGLAFIALPPGAYGCVLGAAGSGKSALLAAVAASHSGAVTLPSPSPLASWRRLGTALRRATTAPQPQHSASALLEEFALDPTVRLRTLTSQNRLRARLALALAAQPRLLLLDEPLEACIDRDDATALLRATASRHRLRVLHATRHRAEAFALADYLVVMHSGTILQQGSTQTVYDRPTSLSVARLLGPATILPGALLETEDDVATVRLDCGPVVEADRPDVGLTAGQRCALLLRPERVVVSTVPAGELSDGAIAAVLREVTHGGEVIRLRLAIGTDTELLVSRPAVLGTGGLLPGRTVSVGWQSRHALIYPIE